MNDPTKWIATARLRWLDRPADTPARELVLQQWWGPELPSYMADPTIGEWRDVPMTQAEP